MLVASVSSLGPRAFDSPLPRRAFVSDDARILRDIELPRPAGHEAHAFEKAGPRERVYFDPSAVTIGIVTAGGICPGINDVVRALVMELHHGYGVRRVLGFRFGFAGLDPATARDPLSLDPSVVRDVHVRGGTLLGSSRGLHRPEGMVDHLVRARIDVLVGIGGDGTMRALHAIHREAAQRGLSIGVVGVPKTIGNDIPFVDKTFGFDTAVAIARSAIDAAHAEACSFENGVGLVKLMGRDAGFIAAHASLASHDVNACLVPEVPFELGGWEGFLPWLEERVASRGNAVVVMAEGCRSNDRADGGLEMKAVIQEHFAKSKRPLTLKYIDPSYTVRAARATSEDAVLCDALARNAVHAAMAGKTDVMVGRWHREYTHVPLATVNAHTKRIDPNGELWRQAAEATGQPSSLGERRAAAPG